MGRASIVDLIEPNGHVVEGIGDGPFTGVRMKVIPVPWHKSLAPQPVDAQRDLPWAVARRLGLGKARDEPTAPRR